MSLSLAVGHNSNENLELLLQPQAFQTYQEVLAEGPPSQPLDFPTPAIHRACFVTERALDHRQGRVHDVKILRKTSTNDRTVSYMVKNKIARTLYGSVRLCVVLRRRHVIDVAGFVEAEWIITDELVALKASSWAKVRKNRGLLLEDPLKGKLPNGLELRCEELLLNIQLGVADARFFSSLFGPAEAASLQLVGNYHSNILGCLEVLQDDEYIYTVMPYCSGGDMCSFIRKSSLEKRCAMSSSEKTIASTRSSDRSGGAASISNTDEEQARVWFRQLLMALVHLQKKGVCHRDLCLENILIEENNLVIVDFGLALRVPYKDNSNLGGVADVSEGTHRLLIKAQGQSGTLKYLAPEIIEREQAFDGFAADLWSAGVLLFVFLVGLAPFQLPSAADFRYAQINRGKLKELVAANLDDPVSDEACDLLQNMLWRDPNKRLTLAQVLQHPWVVGFIQEDLDTENISPRCEQYVLAPAKNMSSKVSPPRPDAAFARLASF